VKAKITEPQLVAYSVHKGPYSQLGKVFKKAAKWAYKNGYEVTGPPRTIYYSEAGSVPDDELITEVQIPIRRTTRTQQRKP
jgi:AraC family transcriptional regulator